MWRNKILTILQHREISLKLKGNQGNQHIFIEKLDLLGQS